MLPSAYLEIRYEAIGSDAKGVGEQNNVINVRGYCRDWGKSSNGY